MNSSEPTDDAAQTPTLDQIFRRVVARRPDAPALIDPPDKIRITGGEPRTLTYREADRIIDRIANHLRHSGVQTGGVVALQMANTVELPLTILAGLRAGLIVAPLPLLWRQADLVDALNRIGARALICNGFVDGINHGEIAMQAAAEVFSIRYVGGFEPFLPEDIPAIDVDQDHGTTMVSAADARRGTIVTFDMTPDGRRAVPRNQAQMIAGGLAIGLEAGLVGGGILSTLMPTSFAGLAASMMTWLLGGATLYLSHPTNDLSWLAQIQDPAIEMLVVPGPLTTRLSEAALATATRSAKSLVGVWRNPEQVAASARWTIPGIALTDVYVFGEIGLFSAKREADGMVAPLRPGPYRAPRAAASSSIVGETLLTPRGTLGLRGPMVPLACYTEPRRNIPNDDGVTSEPQDYVDTGFSARRDKVAGTMTLSAPPAGLVAIGGYRFLSNDLQSWAQQLDPNAILTGLPDKLNGQRLAGRAPDNRLARSALAQLGLNPLAVEAFRDRGVEGQPVH